jgi:hydrogenase 3 maturation protease
MNENNMKKWLSGFYKLVIVGIGNPLRMDDYVGMKIVEDLKGKLTKRVLLIESETVPESYLQQIIDFDPTHVLLIDAAAMGQKPATVKLMECSDLPDFSPVSTHALPLRIFCQCLRQNLKADVLLLLIEPRDTDFGESLSPEIEAVAKRIEKALMNYLAGQ